MIIKKKLRDLTFEEYKDWKLKNCTPIKTCTKCEFGCVTCSWFPNEKTCWVNNKDSYSDKFLNQEIEIKIETSNILTDKEKKYLENVVRPFKDRIKSISKKLSCDQLLEYIIIELFPINTDNTVDFFQTDHAYLPYFKRGTMYNNLQNGKKYTLEELGLF